MAKSVPSRDKVRPGTARRRTRSRLGSEIALYMTHLKLETNIYDPKVANQIAHARLNEAKTKRNLRTIILLVEAVKVVTRRTTIDLIEWEFEIK